MKNLCLIFLICFVCLSGINAQNFCGTEVYREYLLNEYPEYQAVYQASQAEFFDVPPAEYEHKAPVVIPVAVHVVYNTQAQNISDSQIEDAIQMLNEDYRRQNADRFQTAANAQYVYYDQWGGYQVGYASYAGLAADCEIEFCLADITRHYTSNNSFQVSATSYNYGEDAQSVKDFAPAYQQYPPSQYLNVWVCNLASFTGYATFPGQAPAQYDGVTLDYEGMGRTGTALSQNKRALTHEVGHWLGLFHIWGTSSPCGSDYVNDTYPHEAVNNMQSTSPNMTAMNWGLQDGSKCFDWNQCSGFNYNLPYVGMNDNFMEYAPGYCQNFFSAGQKSRMWYYINNYRSQLLSSSICDGNSIAGNNFQDQDVSVWYDRSGRELSLQVHGQELKIHRVQILDLTGKVVLDLEPREIVRNGEVRKYDVFEMTEGIYVIRVEADVGMILRKIVLN